MVSTTSCCVELMFRLRGSFRLLRNAVLWCAHALSVSFFSWSLFSAHYYGDFCFFSRRCWSSKPQEVSDWQKKLLALWRIYCDSRNWRFVSMYSHLVLTLLLLKTEYIYWMRGQLSVPSLTTKEILRIPFTYLPMMYVFPPFFCHSSSFYTNRTYNLFLMVFAPIWLSSSQVKFRAAVLQWRRETDSTWMSLNMLLGCNRICESAAIILKVIHALLKLLYPPQVHTSLSKALCRVSLETSAPWSSKTLH